MNYADTNDNNASIALNEPSLARAPETESWVSPEICEIEAGMEVTAYMSAEF